MKANELRKYNFVSYKGRVIELIGNYDLYKACIDCERTEDYKPVPLTEEWLLKFGFEETIVEGYPLYQNNKGFIVEYYIDESVFLILDFEVRVKHVHQLQNLYFALTGEELELKERQDA